MTTQPKNCASPEVRLLTEAEARGAWKATYSTHAKSFDDYCDELRERGLIAEEPVDPLREAVEAIWHLAVGPKGEAVANMTAELRARGMELAPRKELTREVVAAAWEHYAVNGPYGVDGLHAALTEALQ